MEHCYLNGLEIKTRYCFWILELHAVPSGDAEFSFFDSMSTSVRSAKEVSRALLVSANKNQNTIRDR